MNSKSQTSNHVLVVDDEPTIRVVLRATLESHGFKVTEATDGGQALKLLKKTSFDLVLLDFNMPVVDGGSVMEKLQKRDSRPPVVMLTAYGSVALATRAMRLGVADFLEKPVVPADLLFSVNNALSSTPNNAAGPVDFRVPGVDPGDSGQVLAAVRVALVESRIDAGEALLHQLADASPSCAIKTGFLNLKGLLNELRGRYLAARALYRMATSADRTQAYLPPVRNAWRLFDIVRGETGASADVALGDAAECEAAFGPDGVPSSPVLERLSQPVIGHVFACTPPNVPRPASQRKGT